MHRISTDITTRTDALLAAHQQSIWKRTDRLFAGLIACEWIVALSLAAWLSPKTWDGARSSLHPNLLAAIFAGGGLALMPALLVWKSAGRTLTRQVVAIAQMAMSALLIHVGGGRIEMHFHVFGSLAFLAFYRDWRVLVTGTVVVAADHAVRGIFAPASVYGVADASLWRTVEHAGWVVFENVFLVAACVQAVREMRGIAESRALLEASHREVEIKVEQRTAELKTAQDELVKVARSAGMADIATSVLHNVGNVLNSVNVAASVATGKLRDSELPSLARVTQMLDEHKPDLGQYLTADERGKLIPQFLSDLSTCLATEHESVIQELGQLSKGVEHIKEIIVAQQSMAKCVNVRTPVHPDKLIDTAIEMQCGRGGTVIRREVAWVEPIVVDQHKVLQILINLLSNARQAVASKPIDDRVVTIAIDRVDESVRIRVTDNGSGIASDHLTRIFAHGFTTKPDGHGFGLHSAANAAREMNGTLSAASDGPGCGATFTLTLPLHSAEEKVACR